jgi:hypothetical protein
MRSDPKLATPAVPFFVRLLEREASHDVTVTPWNTTKKMDDLIVTPPRRRASR